MSINRSELNAAIPQPAMERLPLYLNYLKMRLAEGCEQISSAMIAQDLRLTGIQVRKDLAYVSSGRPRTGRNVAALIACLEEALGYRTEKRVVMLLTSTPHSANAANTPTTYMMILPIMVR